MNLPNKLTLVRVGMVPLCVAAILINSIPGHFYIAMFLFISAALTDILDGAIARKQGLVTDFGKLMDPLADKVLVISAMICLTYLGLISPVATIVVVARELMVTSLRLVAASGGKVIAADGWGKAKTWCQDVTIPFIMFAGALPMYPFLMSIGKVMVIIMAVITVYSGINYMVINKSVFANVK